MSKRQLLWTLLALLLAVPSWGRDWTAYLSYHDATRNIIAGDRIYSLASGDLYYYIPGESRVHTFSKVTGLSDTDIKYMAYNSQLSSILLVYSDWNIDILTLDDSISNLPQYKNSSLSDKTVNSVAIQGKYAYLSTNAGLVVLDMELGEFCNTYNLGQAVRSAISYDGQLYVVTSSGIYAGRTTDNLLDRNNWRIVNKGKPVLLFTFDGQPYALYSNALYALNDYMAPRTCLYQGQISYVNTEGSLLVMGNSSSLITMDTDETLHTYSLANTFAWASYDGSGFWVSNGYAGLQHLRSDSATLTYDSLSVIPDSPIRNYCYWLTYTPQHKLLVGGGSLNYSGLDYAATVMTYQDGHWFNFSEDSIAIKTGNFYLNITGVVEDPNDATHHFATSSVGGLFEYRNGKFVRLHTCTNSALTSIFPGQQEQVAYTRAGAPAYDAAGNLWMLNDQVDTIIKIYKADSTWQSIYIGELAGYPTFDKLIFDNSGRAWITHRRTNTLGHHAGILCLDYGGTRQNTADDTYKFQYTVTNQDNTSYSFNQLYDVAQDRDGAIWIGTDTGPFVLRDPDTFFSSPVWEQVKVPRNDGTNQADYLLNSVPITAIAIDGGNRKWFGTSGDGIYLVSADGLTTIHHFTKDNSPLLSDEIYSLAINSETGEVMIGTDKGLIGYRSDATEPATSLSSNQLRVYPNPVRPDYLGNVTVTGFTSDCDVKVVSTGGQVIYQGQSVGGTFTWNQRNKQGKRAATGIYYIIGSNSDGSKGAVAKVLLIK